MEMRGIAFDMDFLTQHKQALQVWFIYIYKCIYSLYNNNKRNDWKD